MYIKQNYVLFICLSILFFYFINNNNKKYTGSVRIPTHLSCSPATNSSTLSSHAGLHSLNSFNNNHCLLNRRNSSQKWRTTSTATTTSMLGGGKRSLSWHCYSHQHTNTKIPEDDVFIENQLETHNETSVSAPIVGPTIPKTRLTWI